MYVIITGLSVDLPDSHDFHHRPNTRSVWLLETCAAFPKKLTTETITPRCTTSLRSVTFYHNALSVCLSVCLCRVSVCLSQIVTGCLEFPNQFTPRTTSRCTTSLTTQAHNIYVFIIIGLSVCLNQLLNHASLLEKRRDIRSIGRQRDITS